MDLKRLIQETQTCGLKAGTLFRSGHLPQAFEVLKHLQTILSNYVTHPVNEPKEPPAKPESESLLSDTC